MLPHAQGSADSLDIKAILAARPCERIMDASLSASSLSSSEVSFNDIPSFPSHDAAPPLFLNIVSAQTTPEDVADGRTITVPTSPRLKSMLLEPIVVRGWAETVPLDPEEGTSPLMEPDSAAPWIPEGRMMPPDDFRAALSHHRTMGLPSPEHSPDTEDSSLHVEVSCDEPDSPIAGATGPTNGEEDAGAGLGVPTIMLSNSLAAVPLSLESSQSLAPLAIRRGHHVPAPLQLDLCINSRQEGLYPGIPSPFLGSPSSCDTDSDAGCSPVDSTMDLDAMCRDLRMRCPPVRPVSPLPLVPSGPHNTSMPNNASGAPKDDSDDWDFAQDMLLQYGDRFTDFHDGSLATPLKITPTMECEQAATPETDSYSWSSTPTLNNSPESPDTSAEDATTPVIPDMPKQNRRRTVIIETPRNSIIGTAQPTRVTIDLSHLADSGDASVSSEYDKPIPFETPEQSDGRTSSVISESPYTRPLSSASMKPPVRGILKTREKKSVRFSMMPSMHEYPEDETEPESSFDVDNEPAGLRPGLKTVGRKRASTEPSCRPQTDQGRLAAPQGLHAAKNRTSFPKHPAVRSFVRGNTPSPTPPSRVPAERQSLQHVLVPRNVDKTEVSGPRRLLKRATLDSPATSPTKSSKRLTGFGDENSPKRRASATPKTGSQKSRMSAPFKSILTKWRA